MKTKLLITALVMMIASTNFASEINEVTGFQNPESVVAYKDYLFVSNTGEKLEPLAKDGDGYISMLSRKDGKIQTLKLIADLNSPKGLYVRKNILYVADVDKIQGYNIDTKKKVFETNLSKYGAVYINDITRAHRGMYVSSTLNNAIYKVKYNGDVKRIEVKGALNGVNGLYRRRVGKLLVANYGKDNEPNGGFGKIGLITKKYKAFTKTGVYDGILRTNGKFYVSDWVNNDATQAKGRIVRYRRFIKKGFYEVKLNAPINGPSDMYADKKTRLLWVPAMQDNKIISIPYKVLKKKTL